MKIELDPYLVVDTISSPLTKTATWTSPEKEHDGYKYKYKCFLEFKYYFLHLFLFLGFRSHALYGSMLPPNAVIGTQMYKIVCIIYYQYLPLLYDIIDFRSKLTLKNKTCKL